MNPHLIQTAMTTISLQTDMNHSKTSFCGHWIRRAITKRETKRFWTIHSTLLIAPVRFFIPRSTGQSREREGERERKKRERVLESLNWFRTNYRSTGDNERSIRRRDDGLLTRKICKTEVISVCHSFHG